MTITCPEGETLCPKSSLPPAVSTLEQFEALGGSVTAECGIADFQHVRDVSDRSRCPELITRTYRITDSCGFHQECGQVFVLDDTNPPSIMVSAGGFDCGDDVVIPCGEPFDFAFNVENDCGKPVVTCEVVGNPPRVELINHGRGAFTITIPDRSMATVVCTAADSCSSSSCEVTFVCGVVECPAPGSCEEPHDTPGCRIVRCCEAVCEVLPHCCLVEWDQECVDLTDEVCIPTPLCPGAGDCYEDNGSPGCEDPVCCGLICTISFYCCTVEWDQQCADQATLVCGAAQTQAPPEPADWSDEHLWQDGREPDLDTDVTLDIDAVVDDFGAGARDLRIEPTGTLRVGRGSLVAERVIVEPGGRLRLDDVDAVVSTTDLTVAEPTGLDWRSGVLDIAGGTFDATDLVIGHDRDATLVLRDGALARTRTAVLASDDAGVADAIVIASTWHVRRTLDVGVHGFATLELVDDAFVHAGDLLVGPSGEIFGDGLIEAPVLNRGHVTPTAWLAIDGEYVQDPVGTLTVTLGESGLEVTGAARLAGRLVVLLPLDGDASGRHTIVTATTLTGAFTEIELPVHEGPLEVRYARDGVIIVPVRE
jgi:hypothetical protein